MVCSSALAVDPLKPTATGDVGLAQGMVSFAHQLHLLGENNWIENSRNYADARSVDLGRVAALRRIIRGASAKLDKIAEQRDLDLSPAYRAALKQSVVKLRIAGTSRTATDPTAMGRVLSNIAGDIESRFDSPDLMIKPSGLMARLRKPKASAIAGHDAAILAIGRVFENAALELTLMTLPDEPPLNEIRYFLKDTDMAESIEQVKTAETFWSGVNEMLGEIAQVMQNTAGEIRPLVADETLPPEYITGMNQIWRILKQEPERPPNESATANWFPGREKLRGFGRPARCERILTVQNPNGSSNMVIEGMRTTNKPFAQPGEAGAESAPHELMMPL